MRYLGDIVEDATIRGSFNTRQANGTPVTLAGTPSLRVYKDAGTTETTNGVTLTVDFDGVVGLHLFTIATTDAFYTTGSDYRVVIAAGTVDGTSVVGTEVAQFSITNRSLPPAGLDAAGVRSAVGLTSANLDTQLSTIDTVVDAVKLKTDELTFSVPGQVDANALTIVGGGMLDAAGVRAAIGLASANLDTQLSAIDSVVDSILVDTAVIGASGAGLTAVPWNPAWDAEVQSECTDALNAYDPPTKAELDSAVSPLATSASLATVDTVVDAIKVKTDQLNFTVAGQVDANALSGGGSGGLDAAGVRSAIGLATANLDTQLGNIPTVAEFEARTVPSANYFDPAVDTVIVGTNNDKNGYSLSQAFPANFASLGINASGHVSRVTLVDTTTTNSDMRGTDNALLASNYTAPDNASIAAILTDTETTIPAQISGLNNLSVAQVTTIVDTLLTTYDAPTKAEMDAAFTEIKGATWSASTDTLEAIRDRGDAAWVDSGSLDATELRAAIGLAAANLDTQLGNIPTNSEFEARTLPSADYFNHAVDTVTVGANNDKTGYSLATAPPTASAIATAVWSEPTTGHSGSGQFGGAAVTVLNNTTSILADTDDLQQNQGNWVTATGFSTHSPSDVWSAATRTLTTDAVLAASQPNYAPAIAGDAMTLTTGERASIASAVWAAGTRTLTGFGTLVSDVATAIWGFASRTITGGTVTTVADKTGYSIAGTITTLDALDTAQDVQHAATQSAIATVDGIVDEILVDTGTTIPAQLTLLAIPEGIGQTLDEIKAKTDIISVDSIKIARPYDPESKILRLYQGDDYSFENGSHIDMVISLPSGMNVATSQASMKLVNVSNKTQVIELTPDVVVSAGLVYIRFEATSEQMNVLPGHYDTQTIVTDTASRRSTVISGQTIIRKSVII
jgi:hypothetical protein